MRIDAFTFPCVNFLFGWCVQKLLLSLNCLDNCSNSLLCFDCGNLAHLRHFSFIPHSRGLKRCSCRSKEVKWEVSPGNSQCPGFWLSYWRFVRGRGKKITEILFFFSCFKVQIMNHMSKSAQLAPSFHPHLPFQWIVSCTTESESGTNFMCGMFSSALVVNAHMTVPWLQANILLSFQMQDSNFREWIKVIQQIRGPRWRLKAESYM